MTALAQFIGEIKTLDLRNSTVQDLGDALIKQAIADALQEYNDYVPRGFRTAVITVNIGDIEILLPVDCGDIDEDTAFLLAYGFTRTTYRVPGAFPGRYSGVTIRSINDLDNTTDPPRSTSQCNPLPVPRSTSDSGRISLLLSEASTEARTHAIRYNALHVISDSPDVNTVQINDRKHLRRLVQCYMAEARARQATNQFDLDKWTKLAATFADARDSFIGGVGAIG